VRPRRAPGAGRARLHPGSAGARPAHLPAVPDPQRRERVPHRPRRRIERRRDRRRRSMRVTTISMLTENRPGVLARVCQLFSRRGFNLLSVCAERTDRFEVYCITVVVRCDDEATLAQIRKQLQKLIDVEEVTILSSAPTVERQVALVKVLVQDGNREKLV